MSLGSSQSFNRYSYVGNEPTNLVDPSGLMVGYVDFYAGMTCVLDPRDGIWHCTEQIYRYWFEIGGGGGNGTIYGDWPPTLEAAVIAGGANVLNDENHACTKALKKAGYLDDVKKKLNSVNFMSVASDGNKLASRYFGSDAKKGETLAGYYNRTFPNQGENIRYGVSSKSAILTQIGAASFLSGSLDNRGNSGYVGFFLHELTHHATGQTDDEVVRGLKLTRLGDESLSSSDLLSKFFNDGCPSWMGEPPPMRR